MGEGDRTQAMVEHIVDFMDAMGIEKAHVEGESMGGANAFRLALTHPDRVNKIVLNTASPLSLPLKGDFAPPYKSIESLRLLSQNALERPNRRTVRTRLEWLMTTPDRVTDELVSLRLAIASMPEIQAAQGGGGLPNPGQEGPRESIEEQCARIGVPALVLWSEFNPDSGTDRGEKLASLIPGAKYYCIDDAAHWPQYEHPEEHDAVVASFLKTGEVPAKQS